MSDDRLRLEKIVQTFLDCDQEPDFEEITLQFKYETGRYPTTEEVEASIRKVARR